MNEGMNVRLEDGNNVSQENGNTKSGKEDLVNEHLMRFSCL